MILTLTLLSTGVVTTVKTSIGQHKDRRGPFASHLECFSIPFRLSWNGEVRKAENSLSGFKTWLLTVHPSRNQWLDSHLLGVRTDTPTVNIIYHRITGIINFSLNELNSLRLNSANHDSDIIRDLEAEVPTTNFKLSHNWWELQLRHIANMGLWDQITPLL